MKSRIMALYGHHASPACKYSYCRTPVEWDLVNTFESIDGFLSESDNCELIEKVYHPKDAHKAPSYQNVHFYHNDHSFYKAIVRNDKPMAMPKEFYIMVMMTDKIEPLLAVNVTGGNKKTINAILDQLSTHTSIMSVSNDYLDCKWNKKEFMEIGGDSIVDESVKQIIELEKLHGEGGH